MYNGEGDTMNVDNPYNLNPEASETQAVSDHRADESVPGDFQGIFRRIELFLAAEQADFTFEDMIAYIGVDPSEYRCDAGRGADLFMVC